jgi:hypothetical protein
MARIAIQRNAIRKHFQRGLSLTPLEALRSYGSFRLGGVVFYLKTVEHMNIKTTMVHDKKLNKTYARYKLEMPPIEIKSDVRHIK